MMLTIPSCTAASEPTKLRLSPSLCHPSPAGQPDSDGDQHYSDISARLP